MTTPAAVSGNVARMADDLTLEFCHIAAGPAAAAAGDRQGRAPRGDRGGVSTGEGRAGSAFYRTSIDRLKAPMPAPATNKVKQIASDSTGALSSLATVQSLRPALQATSRVTLSNRLNNSNRVFAPYRIFAIASSTIASTASRNRSPSSISFMDAP